MKPAAGTARADDLKAKAERRGIDARLHLLQSQAFLSEA